jgi:UDP-N-acetylglucosamine diphosphorylase / glucose-1-phosphate thymidylyltransferase / UDP-N-acetylgalactosamine diphosphorylase / glucosamine-1-phosphate N-acetyltransferase / galactosamine-1-phosphate N-acetyltransferase
MVMQTSYFFDLASFQYKEIFDSTPYPWLALLNLENYIKTLPLGIHKGSISSLAYLIHPELISIGEGTIVEPGAYIQGPCVIGKNCAVRHGAYIRGNVITGDHCVIGHASEIKQTIFMNNTHAGHFAYVGDSILGSNVNLGAGVKCANFRLDGKLIDVHTDLKQRFPTEMRKLGAIIGDQTQLGCNSVTNPGSLIGQAVKCTPCLNIGGFIPSNSFIKS